MHGGVPQGKHGNDFQTGSSFSSAKAAAYGAYIISRHPDVSRDEVVELMKQGSRPFPMELAREKGDLPFIGEARGNESFLVAASRSEEHTSELQSLMRLSYTAFCLKKKK